MCLRKCTGVVVSVHNSYYYDNHQEHIKHRCSSDFLFGKAMRKVVSHACLCVGMGSLWLRCTQSCVYSDVTMNPAPNTYSL